MTRTILPTGLRACLISTTLLLSAALTGGLPTLADDALTVPTGGFTFTCQITQWEQKAGKERKYETPMILKSESIGPRARVEVVSGGDPKTLANGDYLITEDGGKTFKIVSPAKRQYRTLTARKFAEELVDIKGVRLSLRDLKQTPENLTDTETIEGRVAGHCRLTREYTVQARAFFFKTDITCKDTAEYWYWPGMTQATNPTVAYLNAAACAIIAKADAKKVPMMTATESELYQGFPVKAVWTSRSAEGKDKPVDSVTVLEVKNMAPAQITPERFTIPGEYRAK